MPRPQKPRVIYQLPPCRTFKAENAVETVQLTLDEIEAVRLMDEAGLDQAQCARRLNVARTTAQNIIQSARRKIADALVNGKNIVIQGGNVEYSDDPEFGCCRWSFVSVQRTGGLPDLKEEEKLRIAVCYDTENGNIFQHFGKTEYFKVYDIDDGKITSDEVVSTNGLGHGALAGVLSGLSADVLICGGIGGGAQNALRANGINLYGGCSGNADEAVKNFLDGNLSYQEDVRCDHHDHEEGECHSSVNGTDTCCH